MWVVQPQTAPAVTAKTTAVNNRLKPVETRDCAMDYTRAALKVALSVGPRIRPALLTQLFGLYDKIFR